MTIVPIRVTLASVGLSRIAQGLTAGAPAQITQIALGTGGSTVAGQPRGYAPSGDETGLRTEIARVPINASSKIGAKEWMVEAAFDPLAPGAPPQWVTEAAAFTADNVLVGIWSRSGGPLFARVDTSTPLVGFTIALDELPEGAVTFVGVGAPSVHLSLLSFTASATASILELQRREWERQSALMSAVATSIVNAA